MAATSFHQAIGTIQYSGCFRNSNLNQVNWNYSFQLISSGFKLDIALLRTGTYCSRKRSFSNIQASTSQSTVFDPVSSPSNGTKSDSKKKPSKPLSLGFILNGIFVRDDFMVGTMLRKKNEKLKFCLFPVLLSCIPNIH